MLHVLGCIIAGIILFAHQDPSVIRRLDRRISFRVLPFAAGLVAAALFAFIQAKTLPDAVYDTGRTEAALPSFEEGEVPVLASSFAGSTGESLTLLFDFQCIHCRRLHRVLPELLARSGGRILLCPVPLSSACNPYIPASGIDRFAGSCPLTRYALAVWYARPDTYADFWDWLLGSGDEHAQIAPAEAEKRAHARALRRGAPAAFYSANHWARMRSMVPSAFMASSAACSLASNSVSPLRRPTPYSSSPKSSFSTRY